MGGAAWEKPSHSETLTFSSILAFSDVIFFFYTVITIFGTEFQVSLHDANIPRGERLLLFLQKRIKCISTKRIKQTLILMYFPPNPYLTKELACVTVIRFHFHQSINPYQLHKMTHLHHMHSHHFLSSLSLFFPLVVCMSQA